MGWTKTGNSTANAALEVSQAAEGNKQHFVTDLTVSIRGAASGNDIRVEIRDGDNVVLWDAYIDAKRGVALQEHFSSPIEINTNKIAKINIAAAGAGAISTVSFGGYTK